MKFVRVSIFLTLAHVRPIFCDEDDYGDDEVKIRDDDIAEAKQYLGKLFPEEGPNKKLNKKHQKHYLKYAEQESKYVIDMSARKVYPDDVTENNRPCFVQGHALGVRPVNKHASHFENEKADPHWPGKFYACKGNEKGTCPEQCCSGKLTGKARHNELNDRTNGKVCDCVAKGQSVDMLIGAGAQCCSMRAEKKGSGFVCAGIPPLGTNQPLIIAEQSLIDLDVNNCMYPEAEPLPEGKETDRGQLWSKNLGLMKCGRRPCQKHGSKPITGKKDICCGHPEPWDRSADDPKKNCKCSLPGTVHDERIAASESDCCSGRFDPDGKTCSCLPDNAPVPDGAPKTVCCSEETIDRKGTWCRSKQCTPQGQMNVQDAKTNHCCAHLTTGIVYDAKKPCGCVWGGMKPDSKLGSKYHCCSQQTEEDGTCSWIPVPGTIDSWMNETECFSGEADENNKCKCMPPLSTTRSKAAIAAHPDQCCSKTIIQDGQNAGLCSCIPTGKRLGYGSTEKHCCSGKAKDGVCTCARPGAAYKKDQGMVGNDCCSRSAGEHFCHCAAKGSPATRGSCCGKVSTDKKCGCIPDGHLVPSSAMENPASVCCNTPKDTCARQCGA